MDSYEKLNKAANLLVAVSITSITASFVIEFLFLFMSNYWEYEFTSPKSAIEFQPYAALYFAPILFIIGLCSILAYYIIRLYYKFTQKAKEEASLENNPKYIRNGLFAETTEEQYRQVVNLLIHAGKEKKTQKSMYEGANRDAVSNVLIALHNRAKFVEVQRGNVMDIISWLEGIKNLNANFSENPDDFLEKFSYISSLRLRRIAAIEQKLEALGI